MLPLLAQLLVGPLLFGTRLKRSFRPYVLFLTGPSGIGKSECARLLQNFYGDFQTLDDLANWGSTPEYCRQEAARGRGNLWVIDDFKRGKIGDLHWTNALRVLMDYADGQGRHRATPGAKVKTGLPLHCALLVPGEDLPSNETAVLARSLVLEFKGSRNPDLFERCQEWQESYRQVPGPYIAWLQGRDEKALSEQARRRKKFWLNFLEKNVSDVDNAPRLCGAVALNQTSLSEFLAFVCAEGGLTKREAESLASRHEVVLGKLLCAMALRVQETRPAEVFLTHLRELILTGQAVILQARRTAPEARPEIVVGFLSSCGQFVRLIPGPAMALFRETYRKTHGTPFSYSNHAVGRQLLEAGLLMGDGARQAGKKTRYPVGFSSQGTFNAWVFEASLLMPEKELRMAKGD